MHIPSENIEYEAQYTLKTFSFTAQRINIQFIISITFNGHLYKVTSTTTTTKKLSIMFSGLFCQQMLSFDMHTHFVIETEKAYFCRLAFICLYVQYISCKQNNSIRLNGILVHEHVYRTVNIVTLLIAKYNRVQLVDITDDNSHLNSNPNSYVQSFSLTLLTLLTPKIPPNNNQIDINSVFEF